MTSGSTGPQGLGVDIPTLEPEPSFVSRLATLSVEAAPPPPRRWRAHGFIVPAVAVGAVGMSSWLAGAVPGAPSPLRHDKAPAHAPVTPEPSTGSAETPTEDAQPGHGNHNGQNGTQGQGNGGEPNGLANGQDDGAGPDGTHENNGNHNGQNGTQGQGNGGEPNGQANGQDKDPKTPKDPKDPKDPKNPKDPKDPKAPRGDDRG